MGSARFDSGVYNRFKAAVEAGEINTYSCNGMFPGDMRPTTEECRAFFEKSLQTLKSIGCAGNLSFEGGFHAGSDMSDMVTRMKEIRKRI